MMTVGGRDNEVVQVFKIAVVPCQNCPPIADGVGKVRLVAAAGQSDFGGDLDIMPVATQQSDEAGIDAVVIDLKPHRPSLTRSSVERARGRPVNFVAGSFMPVASARMSSLRWSSRSSGGSDWQ